MFKFKKRFKRKPHLITVDNTEREFLECFIVHRNEFEAWALLHPVQRISFRFYFPNAIDFCYDGCKLFTAFFKKDRHEIPRFHELKMSDTNLANIASANWKPFEGVIVRFLKTLEEHKRISYFQQTKSLFDYAAICEENDQPAREHGQPAALRSTIGGYPLAS